MTDVVGTAHSLPVAAEKLGITPATLRQQIAAGKLTAFKAYGRWFVTDVALNDYRHYSLAKPGRKPAIRASR